MVKMVIFKPQNIKLHYWVSEDLGSARGSNTDLCDLGENTLVNSDPFLKNGRVEEMIIKTPTPVRGRWI